MNCNRPVINFWRLLEELAIFENASLVGPGSVKDHLGESACLIEFEIAAWCDSYPPTEIQVCKPLYLSFRAVKRCNKLPEFESIGVIWKLSGSKKAKAKLTCVKPDRLRSSGRTWQEAH
jgi:hypothetical protein